MRRKRSEATRIVIPDVVNPKRREKNLADPHRFMREYFPKQFSRPFERIHDHMIENIVEIARYGGRKAVAAPRGCGKSETCKGIICWLIFAGIVSFPVPVAASNKLAQRLYNDFRTKVAHNDLLLEDFPEVCYPVRALEGAPQRAARQHVDGKLTRIVWTADDYLRLADVPGSPYGGVKMAFAGLDTAIRGLNIDGDRPDLLLIDDPETRESAKSLLQIENRMDMIDKDLAGLGTDENPLAMIMLTTVQNRYCASYQYTDRETMPAWDGVRYGRIVTWPDRMDLWEEYVAKRKVAQESGDRYGQAAIKFYLENRENMDGGCEMLSDYFKPIVKDGQQLVHSALQVCWDKIADTSMEAFCTEYQNDPPATLEPERTPLTVGRVLQTTSGLARCEKPESEIVCITMGIDIGKRVHHWVKVGWDDDATGWILDYDVVTTHGLTKSSTQKSIQTAIAETLIEFGDSDVFENLRPDLVLMDSGYSTDAVYEACHQLGFHFHPVKGQSMTQFRQQKAKPGETIPYWEAYAKRTVDHARRKVWLYHSNTEYWKDWAQNKFLIDTWNDAGGRTPGSLALFEPPYNDIRFHRSFARHMVSESLELTPQEGKLDKPIWMVRDARHNHWLDALGYACAAAGCWGVRAIQPEEPEPVEEETEPIIPKIEGPYGSFVATMGEP